MEEKILITGASGFLGSHIVKLLFKANFKIAVIVRKSSRLERFNGILEKIAIYNIEEQTLEQILRDFKPTVVVHTACDYGKNNSPFSKVVQTNLLFGIDLFEQCIVNNVRLFLNTHTNLGKFVNSYSLSKNQLIEWIQLKKVNVKIINMKIDLMYGPISSKNSFIYWLIEQMIDENIKEIELTSGDQKRDFVNVEDVAFAYLLVIQNMETMPPHYTLDVGTNNPIKVKTFVKWIGKEVEKQTGIEVGKRLIFGKIPYRKDDAMEPNLNNQGLLTLGWKPELNVKNKVRSIIHNHLVKNQI